MPLILEAFKVLFYAALLLFFVGLAVSVFRDGIRACTNKNAQGGAIGDVLLTLVVVSALISMMTQIPESMILMVSGIERYFQQGGRALIAFNTQTAWAVSRTGLERRPGAPLDFATRAIHGGQQHDPTTGAVTTNAKDQIAFAAFNGRNTPNLIRIFSTDWTTLNNIFDSLSEVGWRGLV